MGIKTGTFTDVAAYVDVTGQSRPITITVIPGSGDTVESYLSTTPGAAENPSSANWVAWSPGAVNSATMYVFAGTLAAIKFIRTIGSGTDKYEVSN